MCALLKDGARFTLDLVGSGPEYESLRQLIPELGLDGIASLRGEMPPEDVRREMQRTDIFVFTSDFQEGWGSVLNEAMSSGCAVVASHAAGATPLLVQSGVNGLVYPSGDIQKLAGCIRFFLENPDQAGRNERGSIPDGSDTMVRAGSCRQISDAFTRTDAKADAASSRVRALCRSSRDHKPVITENGIEEEN